MTYSPREEKERKKQSSCGWTVEKTKKKRKKKRSRRERDKEQERDHFWVSM
jgi:hypothetical protein